MPHDVGSGRDEVSAAFPCAYGCIGELQVHLVHQRRGLQRVLPPLLLQVPRGDAPQFVIGLLHDLFEAPARRPAAISAASR
jgi:hypothetical protein